MDLVYLTYQGERYVKFKSMWMGLDGSPICFDLADRLDIALGK